MIDAIYVLFRTMQVGSECGIRIEDQLRMALLESDCAFIKSVICNPLIARWRSVAAFIDFAFSEQVGNQMKMSHVEPDKLVFTTHPQRQAFRLPRLLILRCLYAIILRSAAWFCKT